ncbi:MAG: hypothetical protein A2176_04040 [Spirochaetes bacterium RBG_13_51_14]|nr:MAG: hypothetical protein A2176_04040 [Spirochaetes bacterium RBG_13_51_14]
MDLFPYFERTAVMEKAMSSNLDKINRSDFVSSRDAGVDQDKRKRETGDERQEKENNEAGEHFDSLKSAADLANRELERKNSPYRFYIYREFDDVFINLVRLDDAGNLMETKRKNITHQEFTELIQHIQQGEGLFFDSIG